MATQPEPKSNLGELLEKQLAGLADHVKGSAAAANGDDKQQWYRPDGFDGNLETLEKLSDAFDRKQHNDEFVKAVSDVSDPGTVTDVHLSQLQGDVLAMMERAYRLRHTPAIRSRIHAYARQAGHGHQYGVIRQGLIGHVVGIDRLNKGEKV